MLADEVVSIGEEEATSDSTEPLQDHSSPRQQKSPPTCKKYLGGRGVLSSAPGETRTHTGRVLNPLPLPIGLLGRTGKDVSASSHKRENPYFIPHEAAPLPTIAYRLPSAANPQRLTRTPSWSCRGF